MQVVCCHNGKPPLITIRHISSIQESNYSSGNGKISECRTFFYIYISKHIRHKALTVLLEILFVTVVAIQIHVELHAHIRSLNIFLVEIYPQFLTCHFVTVHIYVSTCLTKQTDFSVSHLILIIFVFIHKCIEFS